jgi:3-hydroxybutyryl-CoA dehydrogenase
MQDILTPVHAQDVPGLIARHVGRGMKTEGLRVAQEAVAGFGQIDAILREQAGLVMGPFELKGLAGLDAPSLAMEPADQQFYDELRWMPSSVMALRQAAEPAVPALPEGLRVWVSRHSSQGHARATALLASLGATVCEKPEAGALCIVTPYGQDVSTSIVQQGLDPARTVALDTLHEPAPGRRRTLMLSPATLPAWRDAAHALLAGDGAPVSVIADSAGFVAQRVVAHVVNIACDIAQQRLAEPQDIDGAVMQGLGYSMGPLAMGDALGAGRIMEILVNMQRVTGNMRYRPSLWLQRRVQLEMPLLAPAAA